MRVTDVQRLVKEWEARRVGASPPDSVVNLPDLATKEVMAACGISPALFSSTAAASAREAYRQFLFAVVSPLGKIFSFELTKSWRLLSLSDGKR